MPSAVLDVAVVGGGVSGAYTCWRLKAADPELNVGLFEYSHRIGGRLYTQKLPGMPHVHAELGGMRYIPKDHVLVDKLVECLGLPTVAFPMGDMRPPADDPEGKPVGADNNLYYLRQRLIRLRDLTRPGEIPYAVSWNESGLDPDQLQAKVLDFLVPNHARLTPAQWFDVKVFGKELFKFGFWDLLFRVLTSEAYAFMKDAGGYDANVANANAVSQLPVGEYGPEVHFRTLRHGCDKLPKTLADRFQAAGGSVHLNHRLVSITKAEGLYHLRFQRTWKTSRHNHWSGARAIRICDRDMDDRVTIKAQQVVLAMPRRSLELVEWDGWKKKGVSELREDVLSQSAFKLLLGYEYPWWQALGLHAGRSITNLPIRQVYYFGTERDQPGGNPDNFSSLLMASYNDIGTVPFWKATENDQPFQGYSTPCMRPGEQPVPPSHHPVTTGMVKLAQAQLREMHGQISLPPPYTAIYHDWTDDPYGGGWHEWKAGVKYMDVMPDIRKPLRTEKVYICGEAYSNCQGWVEGALQTAEKMLRDHFKLARPDWLPASYDLSW